jgi:chromosome segregation ATPase
LNQDLVNEKSRMTSNIEKIQSLQRDIGIKNNQLSELDQRLHKTMAELDAMHSRLQEQQKDMTEMKLKTDILTSTNTNLESEKNHLIAELKETRALQRTFEAKTEELAKDLEQTTDGFHELKKNMISFNEVTRSKDIKIEKLQGLLDEKTRVADDLESKIGTLKIQYQKVSEQFESTRRDLEDTISKLHATNKVRHDLEVRLYEENDRGKKLIEQLKSREEMLARKQFEVEDFEKRYIDANRQCDMLDTKKQSIERQFELTKKQLNEKITNLNEIINGEKETREMWIDRYEKEQRDHAVTNA